MNMTMTHMTGVCDQCGKGRAIGNHDACSKARQAKHANDIRPAKGSLNIKPDLRRAHSWAGSPFRGSTRRGNL
jgi:hypothetical protein